MNNGNLNSSAIAQARTIKYNGIYGIYAILEAYYVMDIDVARELVGKICDLRGDNTRYIVNNLIYEMIDKKWTMPIMEVVQIVYKHRVIDDEYIVGLIEYCRARVHDHISYRIADSLHKEYITPKRKVDVFMTWFRRTFNR